MIHVPTIVGVLRNALNTIKENHDEHEGPSYSGSVLETQNLIIMAELAGTIRKLEAL